MPRIIFKCPYIKPGTGGAAVHLGNYVRYAATREGVEKLTPDKAALPATKKQQAMVERIVRDFPMSRGMFEYEDYKATPTRAAASEFITRAIEDNYDQIAKRENYVSYIAQRRAVQRYGQSTGAVQNRGGGGQAPRQRVAAHHLPTPGGRRPSRLRQCRTVADAPHLTRHGDGGGDEDTAESVPLVRRLP